MDRFWNLKLETNFNIQSINLSESTRLSIYYIIYCYVWNDSFVQWTSYNFHVHFQFLISNCITRVHVPTDRLTSHREVRIVNFLSSAAVYITNVSMHGGTAVATIISGTVALCLKDNRGNSIKWPWMVHSCRSTLFLTGLTDQSAAQSQRGTSADPPGDFSARHAAREFLFFSAATTKQRDAKVNYLAGIYTRMPRRRVRIDLLFSSPRRGALSFALGVSNRSGMVFHPRRARLVLVFRPYPRAGTASSKTETIGIIDFCF